MKNLLLILTTVILSSSMSLAQDYMKILNDQDYDALSRYTNEKVNLEIDRNKSLETSSAAINALKAKLSDFKPTKWSSVHNGDSEKNDAKYFIAEVTNAGGGGLRVFFHLETVGDSKKISSIRIRDILN